MAISAQQVKELRDKTGAGMMDCKKALTEAEGDFEKAIEILRKKGASVAAKRAEKSATEGLILTKILDGGKKSIIAEVNCETDFVADSNDFISFANFVLEAIENENPAEMAALLEATYDGKKVGDELSAITGKIGEKIEVSRFNVETAENGLLVDYVHHGSKLGVIIKADNVNDNVAEDLKPILRDIAMQIAAMMPRYLSKEDVPADVIEKEKEIYKEVLRKEGKPENILDKIAEGKLNKFYQEVCLVNQAFVKDNTKTVQNLIDEFNKEKSSEVKLTLFHRFHVSDEKK
ncbi:MAG: translation elongation factor Ts [Ignavibacteria bacterium]|jgi:elongation factor Ts